MTDMEIISGSVGDVHDGDTFTLVLRQGYSVKVRLIGIDTPELQGNQPYAIEARNKLRQLISDQQIKVTTYGNDQYGRKLGSVSIRGENVSVILVRHGLAKVYRRSGAVYGSIQVALEQAEQLARSEGKGVWGSNSK